MEVSKHFLELLTGIGYHVGHLPKDLWVNEERLPELQPVFALLVNKLSPKTNCVTPRELELYNALLSRYDQFSSLDQVLNSINRFYNATTKDSVICSSDLEALEKKILNSEQDLEKLKTCKDLYETKKSEVDNLILLKLKERECVNYSYFQINENFNCVMKLFEQELDQFGINLRKLHDNVISSIKNDDVCLTKLASTKIIKLTKLWRTEILTMIDLWFGSEKIFCDEDDLFSRQIHQLSLVSQSITELRLREMHVRCEIMKINMALNDLNIIKNDFQKSKMFIYSNEIALKTYISKFIRQREVTIDADLHMTTAEINDMQKRTNSLVITDAKRKILDLETIENRITFVQDSMEHYIMMCDVLWCLLRTDRSMVNLKCELILHSIRVLQIIFDDIKLSEKWTINYNKDENPLESTVKKSTKVVKFEGYKSYSEAYENCSEMDKLTRITLNWKSQYHYSYKKQDEELIALSSLFSRYMDVVDYLQENYSEYN